MNDTLSLTFAALADPTRRNILERLGERDHTLTELAEGYAISVQAVSKHLKVLESAGLVARGRGAGRRPARLIPASLDVTALWLEDHRRRIEERYTRLDAVLAGLVDTASETTHETTSDEGEPS